jgi:hypothetical protein
MIVNAISKLLKTIKTLMGVNRTEKTSAKVVSFINTKRCLFRRLAIILRLRDVLDIFIGIVSIKNQK